MNYNKLKITAESKNYMIKDLAAELGMTPNGLKRSVEANNLTIEKVTMLCKILDISPNEFFDWNGIGSRPLCNQGRAVRHTVLFDHQGAKQDIQRRPAATTGTTKGHLRLSVVHRV